MARANSNPNFNHPQVHSAFTSPPSFAECFKRAALTVKFLSRCNFKHLSWLVPFRARATNVIMSGVMETTLRTNCSVKWIVVNCNHLWNAGFVFRLAEKNRWHLPNAFSTHRRSIVLLLFERTTSSHNCDRSMLRGEPTIRLWRTMSKEILYLCVPAPFVPTIKSHFIGSSEILWKKSTSTL